MNDPVAAAKSAIQGLGPSQVAAAPSVNITPQVNAQGQLPTPAPGQFNQQSAILPEIQQAYSAQSQAPLANAGIQATMGTAQNAIQNAYNQWQIKHMQDLANAANQLTAANVKASAQKIQAPDGGYRYMVNGQPVDAFTYRQVSGESLPQQLKGSTNALDQQALTDYNNLENLTNALNEGDQQAVNKVATSMGYKSGSDLVNTMHQAGIHTPGDLMQNFMQYYPNYFGLQGVGQTRSQISPGGNPYNFLNPQP